MRNLLARAALVSCLAPVAVAQTFTGEVRGAVRDASGAVQGVTVELTNESTGLSWTATSNRSGQYAFVSLTPGTYRLKATVAGFRPVEKAGIHVGTQEFLTMPDIVLELNRLEEQVTVEGEPPLVEKARASVGATLDRNTLDVIPSAGRNAFYLSVLTPNVLHTSDPQFVRQQDQTSSSALSLAGGPKRANKLHPRRRLDHRPAQSRHDHPELRGHGGGPRPARHLRRRDGAHRRRRVQHDDALRVERLAREPPGADAAAVGAEPAVLRSARLRCRPGCR
ncbi:MAG TPA: carboxypeptidase-like regulatory domain-containing protein [Vicinamibacteria bacterium]|nr:carboxypeptidase-like regulatory domain-containing protein [Vicinamibacteria bacterium]